MRKWSRTKKKKKKSLSRHTDQSAEAEAETVRVALECLRKTCGHRGHSDDAEVRAGHARPEDEVVVPVGLQRRDLATASVYTSQGSRVPVSMATEQSARLQYGRFPAKIWAFFVL